VWRLYLLIIGGEQPFLTWGPRTPFWRDFRGSVNLDAKKLQLYFH
jgi:hypothetical protein